MVIPVCRVHSVGEVSSWAAQFLQALQAANIIEVTPERDVERFCKESPPGVQIPIALVENLPESRRWIALLRESGKRCVVLWYGRGFSKEDFHFAVDNRIYRLFENARPDDKHVINGIRRAAEAVGAHVEGEQIVHTLKATLLQGEGGDEKLQDFVHEIKVAVTKLERGIHVNEFISRASWTASSSTEALPFYKQQDFGDAITTVHDLERTGLLSMQGSLPGQQGAVHFLQGKIVGAIVNRVHGLKAIFRMFLWDDPRFTFTKREPDDLEVQEHLTLAMKYIRAEGENFRERFNRIRRELPPADLRLELEPNSLHGGIRLSPDDFSTLSSVVELGHVYRVVDYNPLPDVAIYEALIRLKRNQMIRVATAPLRAAS